MADVTVFGNKAFVGGEPMCQLGWALAAGPSV